MNKMEITSIGEIKPAEDGFAITLKKEYRDGLTNLDGYSHINILWWADQVDNPEFRKITVADKPYTNGPDKVGIFATRSPLRPNPIGVTTVAVLKIDHEKGIVYTPYIDAEPGTPLLDIKPYHGSADVVKNTSVPEWCSHWPASIEDSVEFDWDSEFNF